MIAANSLDDGNLVVAEARQNDVELVLLFRSFTAVTTSSRASSNSNRCCGGYAPLVFEHLDELDDFHDGLCAQFFEQIFV